VDFFKEDFLNILNIYFGINIFSTIFYHCVFIIRSLVVVFCTVIYANGESAKFQV
jgi:hypothetical protein